MRAECPTGRAIEWKREVVTEQPLFSRTRVLHVDDGTPCQCIVDGRRSGASPLSVSTELPEVVVMGRATAERYDPGPEEVCISIHSPGGSRPELREGFWAVLRLAFDDDCFDGWADRDRTITEEDARRVARFVRAHASARRIVVHCEVGISRSASMAEAIRASLGVVSTRSPILNYGVYRRVLEAFARHPAGV